MIKKIKDNLFFQKFKEMRADPKLRPITSLILWLIFMFILVIFTRGVTSNKSMSEEVKKDISSYSFTYTNNQEVIFGSYDDGKMEFYLGASRYYYNGQNVYKIQNQNVELMSNFDLGVLKIDNKFINNLISNLTYTQSDGFKQYYVPLSRFINLYEYDVEVDLSLANQYNIVINVYEDNDEVYMYKLDLSSYYSYRGLNNDGILTIDIYNNDFTFSKFYDELIGGIK